MAVESACPARARRPAWPWPALLAVAWGYGAWLLRQPEPERGRLRVGLVQASILQDDKWDPGQGLGERRPPPRAHPRGGRPTGARLVVWPESAAALLLRPHRGLRGRRCARWSREQRVYLLFGNDDRERRPEGTTASGWAPRCSTPTGTLRLRYHKMRLVPFGEYVPLQSVLTLGGRYAAKLVQPGGGLHARATEAVVGEVDGHRVGASICYEAIFPDLVRQFAARRRRPAGERHQRRLVRPHLGPLPAPGHGRLPRGGERQATWCARPTPASARWWTRAAGCCARTRAVRAHACSCATCPSSRAPRSTRGTATCSPGPASGPAWPSPPRARHTAPPRHREHRSPEIDRICARRTRLSERSFAALRRSGREGRGHPRLSLRKAGSRPS